MEDNLQPYRQAAQQRFPRPYTPPAEPLSNGYDRYRRNPGENYKTPSPGWRHGEGREPYETLNAYYSQPPPRGYPKNSPPAQPLLYSSYPNQLDGGYGYDEERSRMSGKNQRDGGYGDDEERSRMSVSASLTYPEKFPERQQWMRDFQRLNPSMGRGSAPVPFESQTNYSPLRRSRNSRGLLPEVDDFDDDGSNLKRLYPPATRPVEPFGAATSRSVSREREERQRRYREMSPSREREDRQRLYRDPSPSRERDDGRIIHRDASPSRSEVFQRIYESPRTGHRSSLYDSHRSENSQTMDKKDMTQLREQVQQLQDQLRTAKSMLKEVLNTAPDNTSRQASLDLHSQDDRIRDSSIESSSPIPADENSDDDDDFDDPRLDSDQEEPPEQVRTKHLDAGRKQRHAREAGGSGRGRGDDGTKIKKLEGEIAHLLEENERLQIENEDIEERMRLIEQNSMADALLHMKETYAEEVGRRHNLLKQYQEMEKQRLRHMVYLLQEAMQEVKGMQSAEAGWRLHVQSVDDTRVSFWSNTLLSSPAVTWQMRSIPTSQVPLTPRTPADASGASRAASAASQGSNGDRLKAQRQRIPPPPNASLASPPSSPHNTVPAAPASQLSPLTISFDATGSRSVRSPPAAPPLAGPSVGWGDQVGGPGGVGLGAARPMGGAQSGTRAGSGTDRNVVSATLSGQVVTPRFAQTSSGTI